MLKQIAVIVAALAAAVGVITGVTRLHASANESRDAEVTATQVRTELETLQGPAWQADPEGAGLAIVIERMEALERRIARMLADLPREPVAADLRAAEAHIERNVAALNGIRSLVARRQFGRASALYQPTSEAALARAERSLAAVRAGYAARADRLLTRATIGSAGMILLLLAAFGFFYRRSARARDRLGAALRLLERAQEERQRLLGQTVRSAEHERMRIAAELHDGPIQHLASLGYVLDRACRRLRNGDADTGLAHVERARSELTSEVVGLRRVMCELRPPVLDEGGLEAAIRDYAAAFGREHGVCCEVEADLDGVALAPETETVIYRVTQEALANVAKHAGAQRVRIRVLAGDDDAQLWIDDDGSGFDPATLAELVRDGHYGLIGMRERVEDLSGTWGLRSAPGAGTSVHAVLPSAARPAAAEAPELALAS